MYVAQRPEVTTTSSLYHTCSHHLLNAYFLVMCIAPRQADPEFRNWRGGGVNSCELMCHVVLSFQSLVRKPPKQATETLSAYVLWPTYTFLCRMIQSCGILSRKQSTCHQHSEVGERWLCTRRQGPATTLTPKL